MDRLPRLGKRELICLLLFTCNYVVSVWRGFLCLWVLAMGYVILLWHSLSLPYNYSNSGSVNNFFFTFVFFSFFKNTLGVFWVQILPPSPSFFIFLNIVWFGLMLNVPVNNISVMLGRSHRFLGITRTFFGVNMSCSRTKHGDPSGARTPDLWIRSPR